MGREVRRVRPDWQHPFVMRGKLYFDENQALTKVYIPLYPANYFVEYHRSYQEELGVEGLFIEDKLKLLDQFGKASFMPTWPKEEATHYMMYETTSEGTPISPAFATKEDLATWLVSTGASIFGNDTASYETWMLIIEDGS